MSDIRSMTGFGQLDQWAAGPVVFQGTLRGLNSKYFELAAYLPPEFSMLERQCRKLISERISRGKMRLNISMRPAEGLADEYWEVDKTLLRSYGALYGKVCSVFSDSMELDRPRMPSPESIVDIKSCVHPKEVVNKDEVKQGLFAFLKELCNQFNAGRAEEGMRLRGAIEKIMGQLKEFRAQAEAMAQGEEARLYGILKDRVIAVLGKKIDEIGDARLGQEVALLVDKADIREEFDRLKSHHKAFENCLKEGSPIGLKLSFFCQEFLREWNTIASKSQKSELIHLAVHAKSAVEQVREQVQNIE